MDPRTHSHRSHRRAIVVIAAILALGALSACKPTWHEARIDLRVLVIDDGSVNVTMLTDELVLQGVPYTRVDLADPARAVIDEDFLSDPLASDGHARYQGIIQPNSAPAGLTGAERTALTEFQQEFGIRSVSAFAWPGPESGPQWGPAGPGYVGDLDGMTGEAFTFGHFASLAGPVTFDVGAWGALATPVTPPEGEKFASLVWAPIPGTDQMGTLIGQRSHDGIEELQLTYTGNSFQSHANLLSPAIVDWVTRGVHLGYRRNFFSVHVDDLLLPDDRWHMDENCTPGEDCLPGPNGEPPAETDPIRMTADDVTATIAWQNANGFTFDMAYNALGSVEALEQGPDPLTDALLANKESFDWINHTWSHTYLGCAKDLTVRPWECVTNPDGSLQWLDLATIVDEIQLNIDWANTHGVAIDPTELVTGEHSGLESLPQQPGDNPNFAPALTSTGITSTASDNSRETQPRQVGSALTVPRHPMNVFYNVASRAELIDEYNWIYTTVADGGSGICEIDPNSTCIEPLAVSEFETYLVPLETSIAMRHITRNDPRPHYVHQSNLAEERVLLPVMDSILGRYHAAYAANTPIVTPSQTEAGEFLRDMATWSDAGTAPDARVTAYRQGDVVVVEVQGDGIDVPLTVSSASTFGTPYGPGRSDWAALPADGSLMVPT